MKKMSVILVISLLLSMLAIGGYAAAPVKVLQKYEGAVEKTVSLLEQGNKEEAIQELNYLHSAIIEARANLKGLMFQGSSKKLTDPFKLASGVYRVHFTTQGYGIVTIVPFGEGYEKQLFAVFEGDANEGITTSYRSSEERIMIQFSNVYQPYKLLFEKLG